jgi:hypothetical protein
LVYIIENTYEKVPVLYPNPTSGVLTIEMNEIYQEIDVIIRTISGQLVFKQEYGSSSEIVLEIEEPPGIYIIELRSLYKVFKGRIVVE